MPDRYRPPEFDPAVYLLRATHLDQAALDRYIDVEAVHIDWDGLVSHQRWAWSELLVIRAAASVYGARLDIDSERHDLQPFNLGELAAPGLNIGIARRIVEAVELLAETRPDWATTS